MRTHTFPASVAYIEVGAIAAGCRLVETRAETVHVLGAVDCLALLL